MIKCDETWKIVFMYGSHVYGTANENSDEDFLIIGGYEPVEYIEDKKSIRIFPLQDFIVFTEMHEPIAFECVSLLKMNDKRYVKVLDEKFSNIVSKFYEETFNIIKLRKAFSQKASNSFVKAKKKILVEKDFYIGMKSLFHSIRLFDFGIQIAKNHFITDFTSSNYLWDDISKNEERFRNITSEEEYKEFIEPWKKLYNKMHSEFKLVTAK